MTAKTHLGGEWILVLAIAATPAFSADADPSAGRMFAGNLLEAIRGKGGPAGTPLSDDAWQRLERSTWIEDGRSDAQRTVYVFTDPNCPLCTRFWADARPWVASGKVQLRHVLVAVLDESSAGKAAALLSSKEPAIALAQYESRPGSLRAQTKVDGTITQRLEANESLMNAIRAEGTPAIVYRDSTGIVRKFVGAPSGDVLTSILGPR
jgi:thiol:disulfide interchange protein DsbG